MGSCWLENTKDWKRQPTHILTSNWKQSVYSQDWREQWRNVDARKVQQLKAEHNNRSPHSGANSTLILEKEDTKTWKMLHDAEKRSVHLVCALISIISSQRAQRSYQMRIDTYLSIWLRPTYSFIRQIKQLNPQFSRQKRREKFSLLYHGLRTVDIWRFLSNYVDNNRSSGRSENTASFVCVYLSI